MAWISITADDVLTKLAGAELSVFRTAATAVGQADPLPEIIEQVVDEVRGYVAACARNTLGSAGTIPAKLKSATLAMIRYRLITRLPISIKEERKQEYRDALDLLSDVAACRFAVEEPTTATTETLPSPRPRISTPTRRFSSGAQSGA